MCRSGGAGDYFGESFDGYTGFLFGMVFQSFEKGLLCLEECVQSEIDLRFVQAVQGCGVLDKEPGADYALSA